MTNEEVERFVLQVVIDKSDIATIAKWVKMHGKKPKNEIPHIRS